MKRRVELDREATMAIVKRVLEGRNEILFGYLFGSFAEGGEFRDIDIGVYVSEGDIVRESLMYTIRLSLELEKAVGCPADVVLMNIAPDHLIHAISKGKLLVNKDENFREEFIAAAWSRYIDFRPIRRQAVADLFD